MEQWKQILNAQSNSDEVGILDSDVTGIQGIHNAPDGVFYSEFTEDDAITYRSIFTKFAELYAINPRIAISGLEDDLSIQNAAMVERFCPVELVLFSSRYIAGIINSDAKVFKLLKIVVGKLLDNDAEKIAQYILGGWEWKTQLSIFVEAIGAAAPEFVEMAMSYYPQLASLCFGDDKSLLKSYINMLLTTQDEAYAEYFADVVTNEVFMNDNEVVDYFCKSLSKNTYWSNKEIARQIIEEIEGSTISLSLRKKISDVKRQLLKDELGTEQTIHGILNSRNVAYETKLECANRLRFVGCCTSDIFEWEMVRDPDICDLLNKRVMDNIDGIIPDENRGRAYITLATHSKSSKNDIVEFLIGQREQYPDYSVSINIALYDLRVISSEELFNSLFSEKYSDFFGKNLGKYFRYNKIAISNDFVAYLKRYYSHQTDEAVLANSFNVLHDVLDQFNAKDGKLADETLCIADNVMHILSSLSVEFKNSETYTGLLDILELIANTSQSNKRDVVSVLYTLKHNISEHIHSPSVEFRINNDIKKYDDIVAPTGH